MTADEKNLYLAHRFKRRALTGMIVALLALAGLTDGLIALHKLPPDAAVVENQVHVSCPHAECRVPHLGAANDNTPNGLGSGALCGGYLLLCAFIVWYVMDESV